MKKIFIILLIVSLLSCDDTTDDNPFLPDRNVNFTLDLGLPQYQVLLIGGNITVEGVGVRNIVVYFSGLTYSAIDLACPHIELQNCSTMTVDSPYLICPCDGERFQILDGASVDGLGQSARQYNVTKSGNILRISN